MLSSVLFELSLSFAFNLCCSLSLSLVVSILFALCLLYLSACCARTLLWASVMLCIGLWPLSPSSFRASFLSACSVVWPLNHDLQGKLYIHVHIYAAVLYNQLLIFYSYSHFLIKNSLLRNTHVHYKILDFVLVLLLWLVNNQLKYQTLLI